MKMIILLENLKKIICVYVHHGDDSLDRSTGGFLPAWSVHRTTSQVPSTRSFHQVQAFKPTDEHDQWC